MIDIGELKAPKAMRPVVEEVVAITDAGVPGCPR